MFAKSFIYDMFEACILLGPYSIRLMTIDNEAYVALSLGSATLQAPIFIHLDYKVLLPDHRFVFGERHNLIPAVYGVCNISKKGFVTYCPNTKYIKFSNHKNICSAFM